MRELKLEREVGAPAERAWALITDLDRWAAAMSGVQTVERLDGGSDFGVGTRWRETRTMFGQTATEEMEVTAVDPGRSYTVEADSQGTHYVSVLTVVPLGEDRCRVEMTFAGQPHNLFAKVLGATLGRLFEGATRKALQKDLDELAVALEGPA